MKVGNKDMVMQMDKKINKQEEVIKNYLEQQVKFVKELMIQKNTNIENEMNQVSQSVKKNLLNTTALLEEFTLKLKKFN